MTEPKKLDISMISESDFTVQGHGVHTAYVEMASSLARREDVNLTKNTLRRKSHIRHIHTIGPYSLINLLFGSGKKVVSVHVIPASFIGSLKGAKLWLPLATWYLKWFYGRADMLFAVSGTVARELKGPMKLKNRVETFYNTINMRQYHTTLDEKLAAKKALKINAETKLVIGNGQVQPRKRLDTFYETARLMPEVKFIWIGGIPFKQLGADYASMKEIIENPPENVTVTGVIDLAEVKRYLQAADIFFLSAEQENHPMCVLEAAGASLPIILRDIAEYDDTFRGDVTMVNNADAAASEIKKLISDEDYYKKRQKQTQNIAKKFDSTAGAERAVMLYKDILKSIWYNRP